ncbi:MAG: DUF2339 domain-containing protein [Rhodocyclaceae bacterium]
MYGIAIILGLVFGGYAGDSFSTAVLGALCAVVGVQVLRLRELSAELRVLREALGELRETLSSAPAATGHAAAAPGPAEAARAARSAVSGVAADAVPVGAPDVSTSAAALGVPGLPAADAKRSADADPPSAPRRDARPETRGGPDEIVFDLPDPARDVAQAAPAATAVGAASIRPDLVVPEPASGTGDPLGDIGARAWAAARDWLLGGNTVLRVGAVLLFLGLAFLLRYATEGMVVPIEARYFGVGACAFALLGLGAWLRRRRAGYALVLQGTGVGVLYLTVFSAMRLHGLIEPPIAFALLVAVTTASALLAVMQNALGLAVAAALGGFAAPLLASSGGGSHVALFAYILLLDAGLLAIAWFKAWRLLNLVGFAGTFGLFGLWTAAAYRVEHYASAQAFLVAFMLMFVAIGLLFARRRLLDGDAPPAGREAMLKWSWRQGDYVDATVMFGPPLVGFGVQYAIVRHFEHGAALSAAALGGFYLLLAWGLARRGGGRVALLTETCLALGVVFATLAVPLGLDAQWTSAAWAVEAAGIYWLSVRQRRPLGRIFALLVMGGATLAYLATLAPGQETVLAGAPLGAVLIGAALAVCYAVLRGNAAAVSARERELGPWFACAGAIAFYLLPPLLLDPGPLVPAWALAGAATVLAGLRLREGALVYCGFGVHALAGVMHFSASLAGTGWLSGEGRAVLAHLDFWAPFALAATALYVAWRLQRARAYGDGTVGQGTPDVARAPAFSAAGPMMRAALAVGVGWWLWSGAGEALRFVALDYRLAAVLAVLAVSSFIAASVAGRLQWRALAASGSLLVPLAAFALALAWRPDYHPAASLGWVAWAAVFAAHLFQLRRVGGMLPAAACRAAHVVGLWLLLLVGTLQLDFVARAWDGGTAVAGGSAGSAWRWLAWAVLPASWLWLAARASRLPWPVSAHAEAYRLWAAAPLAMLMLGWFWLANLGSDGTARPLPYVPLLNPLELGAVFALLGGAAWTQYAAARPGWLGRLGWRADDVLRVLRLTLGASLFALATLAVCRAAHHWGGVPFRLEDVLRSMQVQAGLSLVWTSIAIGLMGLGHARARRELWIVGAALIAVVVLKLLFVELGGRGGLERIVSFIGVGVLLLAVGYFAPLPPRRAVTEGADKHGASATSAP